MKKIGILGGMGPEATLLLYQKIIQYTNAETDQGHIPTFIYSNTTIPDRTKAILHKGEDPTPFLIESAKLIEEAGADLIAMPCNTAHHYYEKIVQEVNAEFVNMIDITNQQILEGFEGKSVVLFATSGTIESKIYNSDSLNHKVRLHIPDEKDQTIVMDTIYNEVKSGKRPLNIQPYREVLSRLEAEGHRAVILGCTELSYLHTICEFNHTLEFIDPLDVLAKSLVEKATA